MNAETNSKPSQTKTRIRDAAAVALEGAAILTFGTGTAIALAFGKVLAAMALGAFAFGAFLRLTSRRNDASPARQQTPGWVRAAVALLSIVECALFVEAINLPVRFDQAGFQYYHWLFIGALFIGAYWLQHRISSALFDVRGAR